MPLIPGERIVELILEIVLEAMKGQTPEVRKQLWEWHVQDIRFWRKVLGFDKLDKEGPV